MYCQQATISNLILFNTTLVEQTLPWRRQRVPLDQEAGPLLHAVKSVKIKLLSLCFVLCTLEIPRSGTLDLRSVADSRRFWFLRAVRKLSSLCRAAADTAREEVSEDISLNKVETRNSCRHLTWTEVHLRGEVRRATERATSQVRPRQGKLGQAQADLNLSLPLPLS